MNNADWQNVLKNSEDQRLVVIPPSKTVSQTDLEARCPAGDIYLCDAYLDGIENSGKEVVGGYQVGRCINIDHHAPTATMSRVISSTPLAIERVKQRGTAGSGDWVAINHFDCDSVLSAAIMLGILPPEEIFSEAAIAADHTGQENAIADLLQPCDKAKNFAFSLRNLAKMYLQEPLDQQAEQWREEQLQERALARQLVSRGAFKMLPGGVAWTKLESRIDGSFFPALLPHAKVIMQVNPIAGTTNNRMGIRLGLAAPKGVTLHGLDIPSMDAAYGGRWNAGNNNRAGGSPTDPEEYAQQLDERVAKYMPG